MIKQTLLAEVVLWGTTIAYVAWDPATQFATFEYTPEYLQSPVEVSPIQMPRRSGIYSFKNLDRATYKGLPGLLADCLPDKFGNALIDVWLSRQDRSRDSFNPVERLCYMGTRGMGALEFRPSLSLGRRQTQPLDVESMVTLASEILSERRDFHEHLSRQDQSKLQHTLTNLLLVGTSAGGARAKCVIAYNETTGEVLSGQVPAAPEFGYWILKLDGVTENRDRELADPQGFGRMEYAYYKMAKACGIEMTESRLLQENGRAHFMTRRFDRVPGGDKLHLQSLCAMAHYDFNYPGAYSYEQVIKVIRQVVNFDLAQTLEQQFRRVVFNIIGRNQDDHTKNIAFLMDRKGQWRLSPAYDLTYSYNPDGAWTSRHQLSLNGKREHFEVEDLMALATKADIKPSHARKIIHQIQTVFDAWPDYAQQAGVGASHRDWVGNNLRKFML